MHVFNFLSVLPDFKCSHARLFSCSVFVFLSDIAVRCSRELTSQERGRGKKETFEPLSTPSELDVSISHDHKSP